MNGSGPEPRAHRAPLAAALLAALLGCAGKPPPAPPTPAADQPPQLRITVSAAAVTSVAAPRSPIDRVVDDLAQGPMGLYKRLVAYPPLAIVVFDTLTCRGLSPLSHAGLALLTAIGLAGVAAHAMADRG